MRSPPPTRWPPRRPARCCKNGGTAADALVAAQAVLGLVEPQSSGIGGGGFLLYYDAAAELGAGLRRQGDRPGGGTENYLRWISDTDRTEPKPDARASGRSIGVPGILRLLMDVHQRARQDRVARPLRPRRDAGRRRLRHQPSAGRRDRRRRAAAEASTRRPPGTSSTPTAAPRPPTPSSPTRRTQRRWVSSHPTRSRSTPATSPQRSSPRPPTPRAAARRA